MNVKKAVSGGGPVLTVFVHGQIIALLDRSSTTPYDIVFPLLTRACLFHMCSRSPRTCEGRIARASTNPQFVCNLWAEPMLESRKSRHNSWGNR